MQLLNMKENEQELDWDSEPEPGDIYSAKPSVDKKQTSSNVGGS